MINKASKLWEEGRELEAIEILRPAANAGSVEAQSMLGLYLCYYFNGDVFPFMTEGERYLVSSCESGSALACHNLGTLWLGHTPSIGCDKKQAAYFYLKAKELGGPLADEDFYTHWNNVLNG